MVVLLGRESSDERIDSGYFLAGICRVHGAVGDDIPHDWTAVVARVDSLMARPRSTGPTKLYRYFSADGALLYVGVSLNAIVRLQRHSHQEWIDEVARVEIETHPDRPTAFAAEAEAIRTGRPRHNKVLNLDVQAEQLYERMMRDRGLRHG